MFAGGECDCGGDTGIACLEVPEERARILEAVWGTAAEQRETRLLAQKTQRRVLVTSMGGLSLAGAAAFSVAGLGPGVLVWGMLGSIAGGMFARQMGIRDRSLPTGAVARVYDCDVEFRGRIRGQHGLVSPARAEECLAYGIELRVVAGDGERVMYRDAVTCGFSVEVGTGEVVDVPAGRLRFAGDAPEILDVDNLELEAYLDEVDPLRDATEVLRPLHFNIVREEVLFAGDEVELGAHFEREAIAGDESASYREAVSSRLRPTTLPLVRRLR